LVVGISLHERHDPATDLVPPTHFTEEVFDVRAVLGEKIGEGGVVGRGGAFV
jgi:hypothetical protein